MHPFGDFRRLQPQVKLVQNIGVSKSLACYRKQNISPQPYLFQNNGESYKDQFDKNFKISVSIFDDYVPLKISLQDSGFVK